MVDTSNVKFPITLEEFTRLQRLEMHHEPTAEELEIFSEIVETANEAYHAAAAGDSDTVEDIFNAINCAAAEAPEYWHVAALLRGWANHGMLEGMKILKKKLDSMK